MKKYAVAVLFLGAEDGVNEIKIVEAEDELQAIMFAVGDEEMNYKTVEEAIQYYFNGDIAVSEPIEL
jgi:hypothetical protein